MALGFEAAFLAFSLTVLSSPTKRLASPSFKLKYGALCEDLKGSRSSLSILAFHNLRLFVLVLLLVLFSEHPVFQSTVFIYSAAVGMAWDLGLMPYEGALLQALVMFQGTAKLVAAAGYCVLTIPKIGEAIASRLLTYEVWVLAAAMVGGLVLATVQQGIAIYRMIHAWWNRRKDTVKVYEATPTEISRIAK